RPFTLISAAPTLLVFPGKPRFHLRRGFLRGFLLRAGYTPALPVMSRTVPTAVVKVWAIVRVVATIVVGAIVAVIWAVVAIAVVWIVPISIIRIAADGMCGYGRTHAPDHTQAPP